MAEEEIGSFKIRLETDGSEKVVSDIERIRAGLRNLNDEFQRTFASNRNLGASLKSVFGGGNLASATSSYVFTRPPEPARETREIPETATRKRSVPTISASEAEEKEIKKGFIRSLSESNTHSKKLGKELSTASSILRRSNVFGSKSAGMLGSGISKLASIITSLGSKIGTFGLVFSALGKAYDWFDEKRTSGKETISTAAGLNASIRNLALNPAIISEITRQIAYQFKGVGSTTNWEEAIKQSATTTTQMEGNIQTDISLFRTRGRIPAWMRALWMQGVDTSGIANTGDLINAALQVKNGQSEDQFRTFLSEANLPSEIKELLALTSQEALSVKAPDNENVIGKTLSEAISKDVGNIAAQTGQIDASVRNIKNEVAAGSNGLSRFLDQFFGTLSRGATRFSGWVLGTEKLTPSETGVLSTILPGGGVGLDYTSIIDKASKTTEQEEPKQAPEKKSYRTIPPTDLFLPLRERNKRKRQERENFRKAIRDLPDVHSNPIDTANRITQYTDSPRTDNVPGGVQLASMPPVVININYKPGESLVPEIQAELDSYFSRICGKTIAGYSQFA